jgi:hypothetical protein
LRRFGFVAYGMQKITSRGCQDLVGKPSIGKRNGAREYQRP